MNQVEYNDEVTLSYEGRLADGEVFATSRETGPLSFKVGEGLVLPGIEKAVIGMLVGETKRADLEPDDAFGPVLQDLFCTVEKIPLHDNASPKVGMIVTMKMEREGQEHIMPAQVIGIEEKKITLDFNHPLAGKVLTFSLTVDALSKAISNGAQCNCASMADCEPGRCRP